MPHRPSRTRRSAPGSAPSLSAAPAGSAPPAAARASPRRGVPGSASVPCRPPVAACASHGSPRNQPRGRHRLETEHDPPACTDSKRPASGPGANAERPGAHRPAPIGGPAGGVEKLPGPADPAEMLLGPLAAVLSLEQARQPGMPDRADHTVSWMCRGDWPGHATNPVTVPCPALEDTPWCTLDEPPGLDLVWRVAGTGQTLVRTESSKTSSVEPPASQAAPSMRLQHG